MSEQHSFRGFAPKPSPPPTDSELWKREFWKKVRRAEKIFGRGPTYSTAQIEQILEGIIPEWIFRGIILERNPVLRDQCEKARVALLKLHELLNSPQNRRVLKDVKK